MEVHEKKKLLLLRVLVFTLTTSFIYDYIANDRLLWIFPKLWEVKILSNPIENSIFVILVTINLVLVYLKIRAYFSK